MKNVLRFIAVLLVSIASSSYTMGDKSGFDAGMGIGLSAPSVSVPRLGDQMEERRAEHEPRQVTGFEQGIVKKAIEKLENIFKEQERRELEFNLLTLPFELQELVLARLTQSQLGRLACISRDFRDLANNYRQKATILNLSNEPNIALKLLFAVSKLYPNLKKIIIYNPKIKTRFTPVLILALTKYFPKLEYIKLLDHVTYVQTFGLTELYSWEDEMPNRAVEYIQITPEGELHPIDSDTYLYHQLLTSFDCYVSLSKGEHYFARHFDW